MKTILVSLMMSCGALASIAQNKADIEVSYNYRSFYNNGVEKKTNYHLLANTEYSKFYNPQSEEIDSITSTPEGLADFKKYQQAALQAMISKGAIRVADMPVKKVTDYTIKSSKDSMITVYDMVIDDHFYYTEPFSEMVWEIGDSTKNILGYECIEAHTDYHGRRWTAWFSPEIPVQDGPWKFRGLPGLILEATTGSRGFFADGIETSTREIVPVYSAEKYEKGDRKEILRMRRAAVDNPLGQLAAKGMLNGVTIPSNGKSSKSKKSDFLETDYR